MSNELREALEKAIDSAPVDEDGDSSSQPAASEPGVDSGDGKQGEQPPPAQEASSEQLPASGTQEKTELKATESKGAEQQEESPPQPQAQPQPATALKPPVSLKPEARAEWNKVPPLVQAEIVRRDREVSEALRVSSEARRFQEEFQRTVAPYEMLIRAENSSPIQAVDRLLQTAAALRTAAPAQKAQMVATIVREYGIDIRMLDSALSGAALPRPDPQVEAVQQQIAPLVEFVNGLRQQQATLAERTQQEAASEIEAFFADTDNYPYAEDLREEIADLLELNARRGRQMSLQDAYARATIAHPTISKLVENSRIASSAAQQNAAAQRAKQVAASVKGAPSAERSGDPENQSIRGALEAAIGTVEGRIR